MGKANWSYNVRTNKWILSGVGGATICEFGNGIKIGQAYESSTYIHDGYGISLSEGYYSTGFRKFGLDINADTGGTSLAGDVMVGAIRGRTVIGTTQATGGNSIYGVLGGIDIGPSIDICANDAGVYGVVDMYGDTTISVAQSHVAGGFFTMWCEGTTTINSTSGSISGIELILNGTAPTTTAGINPAIYIRGQAAWQYGMYIASGKATNGIYMAITATASGTNGILVSNTFTLGTTGVHKGIQSDVTYAAGYATPIGVAGKVSLTGAFTGGVGYIWGVQGQVDFGASSTYNCAGGQVAAVRAVLTTGGGTFQAGNIACIYADNLITSTMTGTTGTVDLMRLANHGGAIDNAIEIRCPNTTNLFYLDGGTTAGPVTTTTNTTPSGTIYLLKVLIGSDTCYMFASTGTTT